MDNMKNIKKIWLNSLSFLDNNIINSIIVIILVLYSSGIFENINNFIANIYNFSIIRLIVLLFIIYLAPKDITIAILLAISYIISIHYMKNTEYFYSDNNKPIINPPKFIHSSELEKQPQMMNKPSTPVIDPSKFKAKIPMIQPEVDHESSKKKMKESFTNNKNIESFFSLDQYNNNPIPSNNISNSQKSLSENYEINNSLSNSSCMEMYDPKFETISDVCSPTATFKNELNAQGLNFPEGHNSSPYLGSPL
jgi:hypothetical protein